VIQLLAQRLVGAIRGKLNEITVFLGLHVASVPLVEFFAALACDVYGTRRINLHVLLVKSRERRGEFVQLVVLVPLRFGVVINDTNDLASILITFEVFQ
jgi:hypothetical protein